MIGFCVVLWISRNRVFGIQDEPTAKMSRFEPWMSHLFFAQVFQIQGLAWIKGQEVSGILQSYTKVSINPQCV